MSVLGYLQKVGRALMVPVAVLPAAAILMGIGNWIDPNGWDSALAVFLIKAGTAVIDNMPILFAVGVAYGLSKDKDGAAALSGLVGFLVVTSLLSPSAVAQIQSIPLQDVSSAFNHINNQFIAVIVGILVAELYNKFSDVELHHALAFFSGRRLVPIIVSIIMILVSFLLMIVWPLIFTGLQSFGENIAQLGEFGAGVYAFFNRLLIPVGLHHVLNSVFWFDVAGINDIPNFLSGQLGIDAGTAVIGKTGMYQAGFFPIMMFGLPGAALAVYTASSSENKEKVASIMFASALASFFTGVTEPLEFSFMFAAPLLYIIHALLTGISVFFAAHMEWIAGFGFSAGFVDMLLSSKNPLAKQWYMLIFQGLAFFVIYYFLFLALIKGFDLKTLGRESLEDHFKPVKRGKKITETLAHKYIVALGGKANIESVDACITRLNLTLKNRNLINEAGLKSIGAMGVVKLGEQNLQVIIGPQAEIIANGIKALQ